MGGKGSWLWRAAPVAEGQVVVGEGRVLTQGVAGAGPGFKVVWQSRGSMGQALGREHGGLLDAGLQMMVGGAPASVAPSGASATSGALEKANGGLLPAEVRGAWWGFLACMEGVNWPGRRSRSLWRAVGWAVWHQCPSLLFAPTGHHCMPLSHCPPFPSRYLQWHWQCSVTGAGGWA